MRIVPGVCPGGGAGPGCPGGQSAPRAAVAARAHEREKKAMWLDRHMFYEDGKGEWKVIGHDGIGAFYDPLVILGDPGVGRTALLRRLCEEPGMTYVHAAALVRAEDPEALVPEAWGVAVDGLDEIATPGTGSAVEAVLRQLSRTESSQFVLSCRTAEWRDAVDRARIEDNRAGETVTMHLISMGDHEARTFLEHEFPGLQVPALLQHLKSRALTHVCRNPLVLRMFGEVARAGGGIPETRTELFAGACRAMLGYDRRQSVVQLVRRDEDDLLLASGAVCATLLLCDFMGVYDGPDAETPAGYLDASAVGGLPFAGAAPDALRTRLFRAEGDGRYSCEHRAFAEYLGANWLTRCVDEGLADGRILDLFDGRGGVPGCSPVPGCFLVPTALRGLHAWIARLSPVLAGRCIAADPYAVLRDRETETLDEDRLRSLLAALKERSGEDPWFDMEDRGVHPAAGLMRRELTDDVMEVLAEPAGHAHLTEILVEAMAGSDLSAEAGRTLQGILLDRSRDYGERVAAFRTMAVADVLGDEDGLVLRLLDIGDPVSARLACVMLADAALNVLPARMPAAAARRKLRLVSVDGCDPEVRPAQTIRDGAFGDLNNARRMALLDFIAVGAPVMIAEAQEKEERWALTDLARRLAARALETDPAVAPERVWTWIGWTNEADGEGERARERLAAVFRSGSALRAALLEHVLLTPNPNGIWMAVRELEATGLGLQPDAGDFAGLLKAARPRAEDGTIDAETWEELLVLAKAAGASGNEEPDPAVAAEDLEPEAPAGQGIALVQGNALVQGSTLIQGDGEAGAASAAQHDGRGLRDWLSERTDRIDAGDFRVLALPAAVYLGRSGALGGHAGWDSKVRPGERLREFLGEELSERVQEGFVAVLGRRDLPGAAEIVQAHCEGGEHEAEAPLICGTAVALGKDLPLEWVEPTILEAALMAWRRKPGSASDEHLDIGLLLEDMVFRSVGDIERYFRASIEPQLACNVEFVREIGSLADEYRFGFDGLSGSLAVEWLRAWPAMNADAQAELLTCAFEHAPRDALRELVVDRRGSVHPDELTKLNWLSVACFVDLDGSRQALLEAAEGCLEFLGFVRDRISGPIRFADMPLESLVFVVEAFGRRWPRMVDRPGSDRAGRGWNDPRDASAFIERTIHAIANRPEPEAGNALLHLIANHAPTYADTARRALVFQRRVRRDSEQEIPTVDGIRALMTRTPEGLLFDSL